MTKQTPKLCLFIFLLFICLFLSACAAGLGVTAAEPPAAPAPEPEEAKNIYKPEHKLSMEETIEQFLEQQYISYLTNEYIDISSIFNASQVRTLNSQIWLQNLLTRRKLILENDFCYVETTRYPYTITYVEEPEDDRQEFWRARTQEEDLPEQTTVHFVISGEPGKVYPPFFALNSQHSMRLKETPDGWKIIFHYYTGSSRLRQNEPLELIPEAQMLAALQEEFAGKPAGAPGADTAAGGTAAAASSGGPSLSSFVLPSGAVPFDAARALQYALKYTESPNPNFYKISDWMGNCANFTSQCLWFGFTAGENPAVSQRTMTSKWYGGGGGGSAAWENVEQFWKFAASDKKPQAQGMHGEIAPNIWGLRPGGIVQTRADRYQDSAEPYNHNLILLDTENLILAQNTPAAFTCYADLLSADKRFYNPLYLIR